MILRTTTRILIFLLTLFSFCFSVYAQEVEIQSSGQIKNVKDPVDPQDAVTKAYLDQFLLEFGVLIGPAAYQSLLNAGIGPLELLAAGAVKDSLYGKIYQGGLIFYLDDQDTISGVKGLVAAPPIWDGVNDPDPFVEWGCAGNPITGADGTAIGAGFQNTIDIEAGCTTDGIAADICANLDLNDFDDWFLPSKYELNEMYVKIGQGATGINQNIGAFADGIYLSSSEINDNEAWMVRYNFGSPEPFAKFIARRVRAIRAF